MCARYTLRSPADLLAERFGLLQPPDLQPRFNIAPSQLIPVIGTKAGGRGRGLTLLKWGFVPHWAQDDTGPKPVNARSERIATTPMFADAFRHRRCIIPADGFYEWRTVNRKKLPVHFQLKDGGLFGFAGVWDLWNGPQRKVYTCAILTTNSNELVREVHDRMPVILARSDEDAWLDPKNHDAALLVPMLKSYPAVEMEAAAANPAMKKPAFEGPECLSRST
jgi:putative SOS response-associated peptidase YedK